MSFSIRTRAGARWLAAAALALATACPPAVAVERADLYTATVPVQRDIDRSRERAYADALIAVVARIVPPESRQQALAVFESPAQWVQGWQAGPDDTLIVSFDGRGMTALLRAQGIPVWGSDRPQTLVWLAIEDRRGTRRLLETLAPPPPAVDTEGLPASFPFGQALADAAQRFGLPVRLPRLDEVDRAAVTDSDIWGGFTNVILDASRRYGVDSVLVGRVSERDPDAVRWTWLFAGDESRFNGDMDMAMARVGNRMMAQFASSPVGSADVRVSVVAVEGLAGYGRLMQYLQSLSLVERVRVLAVRGDQVLLAVDALVDRERLADMLGSRVLERVPAPAPAAVTMPMQMPMQMPVPGAEVVAMPDALDFDAADLFFRLRPAEGAGD